MDRRDGDRRRRRMFDGFLPSNLSNLKFWVSGDFGITESSGDVSQWNDRSGNGLNAVQGTALDQPTLVNNIANGKPVIRFDGTDHFMTAGVASDWTFLSNGTQNTSFIVWKTTDVNPDTLFSLFSTNDATVGTVGMFIAYDDRSVSGRIDRIRHSITNGVVSAILNLGADNDITPQVFAIQETLYEQGIVGDDSAVFVDGVATTTAEETAALSGANPLASLQIGRVSDDSLLLKGDIAEIIIYTDAKSPNDRLQIRTYLANKYNISI